MNQAASRSQYISHKLITSTMLSIQEISLLSIINSRPHYCLENLTELGRLMNRSARTVQRTIEKLVSKGIVKRTYTTFKRLKLVIVSMAEQESLLNGGIMAQVFKYCSFKKRKKIKGLRHDTTSMSELNTTLMSDSINRRKENKSIFSECLKKMQKGPKDEIAFEREKERQLKEFALLFTK
jgi:DNA-binding MarR family transcriptional regulator